MSTYITETVDGESLAEMNKFAATEVDSETLFDQLYLIKSTNAILNKRLCSFGTRRSILWKSDAPSEVVDGRFENHFTEL